MMQAILFPFSLLLLPTLTISLSSSGGSCNNFFDCVGQLICANGKCRNYPDGGAQSCRGSTYMLEVGGFGGGGDPSLSSCGGPCNTLNGCEGQLICTNGKCDDDPEVGTNICGGRGGNSTGNGTGSPCGGPCKTQDNCARQLVCIQGKCDDDPDLGNNIRGGGSGVSSCGGLCKTLDDCEGQLICTDGKCNDDPDIGTQICGCGNDTCRHSGILTCPNEQPMFTFACSPPVNSSTPAVLTNNDFSKGAKHRSPSKCDKSYYSNTQRVVALSTGWYAGGSRCGKIIHIVSKNGKNTTAKVVDECDSLHGCDAVRWYKPVCRYNVVDASDAVWEALGLDIQKGEEPVTWSLA